MYEKNNIEFEDCFSKSHAMYEMYNAIRWILWKIWDLIPVYW